LGSNKATSYVRALDVLNELLMVEPLGFDDCQNIWDVQSIERLYQLYLLVKKEKNKNSQSVWNLNRIPSSYLANGFCSAALKCYMAFIVEYRYEKGLWDNFIAHDAASGGVEEKLSLSLDYPKLLLNGLDLREGKDIIREVSVRVNQNIFRTMILKNYNQTCCITGLNIPEINRASHIVPWVKDKSIRLDPCNGLCLSATYDAAFDRNLISLDADYRIILSKDIHSYFTNDCVSEYFKKREGQVITLPHSYLPNKHYLEKHRESFNF
jgi:putative restriction endonuclease